MAPELGKAADRILRRRGIELILNARVRAATRHGVYLSTGAFVATRTFVSTVGNAANPVVKGVIEGGGFAEAKVNGRGIGAFETDRMLACVGKPCHWAVGDNAGVPDPEQPGKLCPPTAQFAIRQAKTCARNILAVIDGRPLAEFRYRSRGMLASLGQRAGVAEIWGVRFSGFLAWLGWRAFYWSALPGMARRLRVALDWGLDLVFPRDIAQLQPWRANRLHIDHYEPGELIIGKNEIGRELYIIRSGEVEVFDQAATGSETLLAKLGKGEVFGEKALLDDTPRTASVRAKTPVDVLVISREDFVAMVERFPVLEEYFDKLMRERFPGRLPAEAPLVGNIAKPFSPGAKGRLG
jgi:NADH dehydrogenase